MIVEDAGADSGQNITRSCVDEHAAAPLADHECAARFLVSYYLLLINLFNRTTIF